MVSVVIVSDIRLYREGLAQVLGRESLFRLAGTASGSDEAMAQVEAYSPDLLLVDMALAESADLIRNIRAVAPDIKVVALSVAETERDVCACAEAGVSGYVARHASLADLVATLESAARGEALCSPRMAASLIRRVAALARTQPAGSGELRLTPREREILPLLDGGLANKEIATRLGIEVATVKNHVHNILDKLQVHRRGEAAALARSAQTGRTPQSTC